MQLPLLSLMRIQNRKVLKSKSTKVKLVIQLTDTALQVSEIMQNSFILLLN